MSDKVTAWLRGEGEMPEPPYVVCEIVTCVSRWQHNVKSGFAAEADWGLYHLERIIKKIRKES